ncbi:hypothetical protein F511_30121 [Dorcoceras hygrometricum]|uniref:Uncharacterized protein n=1 Tax=Dorcoceras hygrometricum TaxID=472368 RepID=A0A2Z7AAM4_9LAMI|nr:hypothetical protein F511_30121 [Dorcoceras hygrometricum]
MRKVHTVSITSATHKIRLRENSSNRRWFYNEFINLTLGRLNAADRMSVETPTAANEKPQ